MYNYGIQTVFNWFPENPQWWICSFNPNVKYEDNRVENQVMIGSVQFPNDKMYEAFVKDITENNHELLDFLIFDNNNRTVWICWCEVDLIQ